MKLYIDTKPELEWDEYDGTAESEYGIYVVEANHIGEGYNTLLHVKGRIESIAPIVKGDTRIFDYEAIQQCRVFAQADYDRRTAERFKEVEMPARMNAREGDGSVHYCTGWNDVLEAIDKAREGKP